MESWKHLLWYVLKDVLSVLFRERPDALDYRFQIIEHLPTRGVFIRACPGVFRPKHTSVGTDDPHQELNRFGVVQHRIEVELLELDVEAAAALQVAAEERAVAPYLVRHCPATVTDDDLQIRELVERLRGDHRNDAARLGGNEVVGIRVPG